MAAKQPAPSPGRRGTPRGPRAAPDADRFNYERDELEPKIKIALGGRCAEEPVFGQPSTGAESDRQQLTEIARQMVGRWGMSDRTAPSRCCRDLPAEQCRQACPTRRSTRSTTRCRRIVEQHTDVLSLLRENRDRLDALANELLEHETLGEEEAYAAAGRPEPGSAQGGFAAAAFTASPSAA